jgi:aminoglycoside 3-N-acetyltransferase
MDIQGFTKRILPAGIYASLAHARKRVNRARIARLPLLTENDFTEILTKDLNLSTGDTVFIHSAMDQLNLDFPFYRILSLLQNVVGTKGTVLFPTYPNHKISSYEYLLQGKTFDVRRTPSYIGLLTEFARRRPGALRSLHPTKSVCAIGRYARELTATHQNSPYPYDTCSPYYKLTEYEAKIIGLGVWTSRLSFVYCVDDALKENAPVQTYHPKLLAVPCINYDGEAEIVETYAHDMRKIVAHDVPGYMKRYIPADICRDLTIKGMKFFTADAAKLFAAMLKLAKEGTTIYSRSVYSRESLSRQKSD